MLPYRVEASVGPADSAEAREPPTPPRAGAPTHRVSGCPHPPTALEGCWRSAVAAALLTGLGLAGCADPPPPSVILVSFDTTRADRLGAYGNPRGLTPNLDRFAAQSTVFEHAYTQATVTAPSHTALFTARYPVGLLRDPRQPQLAGVPTLAEVLHSYGYATGAFVGGGDLAPEIGLTKGFDTYASPQNFGSFYHTIPPALAWLDQQDPAQPVFAFIHSYDAHNYLHPTPFGYLYADPLAEGSGQEAVRSTVQRIADGRLLPSNQRMALVTELMLRPLSPAGHALIATQAELITPPAPPVGPDDIGLVRDVYDGAVAYADFMFGLLMAGLEARGILDNAVVIVVSDHGEQLAEDGFFHHCYTIDEAQAQVVLMIRLPDGAHGGRRATGRVGLIDVMPTVLDLMGAMAPAGMDGQSLVPALDDPTHPGRTYTYTQGGPLFRSVSVADATGRLTYAGIPPFDPTLPDMVASASLPGPGFVAEGGPSAADQARLRDALVAWLRVAPRAADPSQRPLPPELTRSIREHGYFDVDPP